MLQIGIQYFGGRGSGGGKGASGGGARSEDSTKVDYLVNQGMNRADAERYLQNENKIASLEREFNAEMSSSETRHSVGWRQNTQAEIRSLREENRKLRWGR